MRFGAALALVAIASTSVSLSIGAVEMARRTESRAPVRELPPGEGVSGDELVRMRRKNARRRRR